MKSKQTLWRLAIAAFVIVGVVAGAPGSSAAAVEPPATSTQIEQANQTSTASGGFNFPPTVDIALQSGTVTADKPGQIELYMDNSRFNDQAAIVELRLEVPRGTEVSGGNFFEGSGGNTIRAEFRIKPGTERVVTANIHPDETGEQFIDAIALYKAEGSDKINQQVQSYPMTVEGIPESPSSAIKADGPSNSSTPTNNGGDGGPDMPIPLESVPWSSIAILVIVSGAAIALVVHARNGGQRTSQT